MKEQRYIRDVVTLQLDDALCTGCGRCMEVCPHAVFTLSDNKAVIQDRDACMECGACVKNCPVNAISVRPGVGCANAILMSFFRKGKVNCGGDGAACC
jgi:NAD-dependent dihydropyrimidine dehydrogenase PreA subunit